MNTLDSIARQIRVRPVVVWAALLALSTWGSAEEPASVDDVSALRHELRVVRQELNDLEEKVADITRAHAMFMQSSESAIETVTVPVRMRPALGDTNAPLVLVGFADSQCMYSRAFHERVLPELRAKYIDTGRLLFVDRTCVLNARDASRIAAQFLLGARALGKYWEMREKLFAHEGKLTREVAIDYAKDLDLNVESMETALNGDAFVTEVLEDRDDARAAGIHGTPSFVLGRRTGETITGERLVGVLPISVFDTRIRELLKQKPSGGSRFGIKTIGIQLRKGRKP